MFDLRHCNSLSGISYYLSYKSCLKTNELNNFFLEKFLKFCY